MDGQGFDRIVRGLTSAGSRRQIVGGVLGGAAALLGGAAALEAKRGGNGKSRGKGNGGAGKGRGKGNTKRQICHYQGDVDGTPTYKVLTLGAPGAENHLKNHEEDTPFVDCCPGDECPEAEVCFTSSCVEGECTTAPAPSDTPCETTEGSGLCDGEGNCDVTPVEEG